MKRRIISIAIILVTVLYFNSHVQAQEGVFVTLEYMHVKPGNDNAYLQLENYWRKIHQAQLQKGIISGWSVWEVVAPYDINAPYQYVVLTVYPKFSAFLHPYDSIHIRRIFPGVSEDTLSKMFGQPEAVRDLVKRDIFSPDAHVGDVNGDSIKYLMATYVKVTPENEQLFDSFMKDHWTPMATKVVKGGFAKFWWYGSKEFGAGQEAPYNHIMVVNWGRDNFFDDVPPFAQYQKEDPAAFEGYKFYSRERRELLRIVVSLGTEFK